MDDKNFTPFPVLKTARLTLRQLVSSDADEIFALRSNETVNKYLGRTPGKSLDNAVTFIKTINERIQRNDSLYWAITPNDSEKLIGTICLFNFSNDNSKAEIGYELLPELQRKGIMQEAISRVIDFAFQHVALHSIEAYTHVENVSSTRLLEKSNFKKSSAEGNLMLFISTNQD